MVYNVQVKHILGNTTQIIKYKERNKLVKKITFIASLILLFTSTLSAGEFSATGMKLGLNYSKFIGKDIPGKGVSLIPGFSLGGFLTYKINSRFSIQPEIFITTKGSNINTVGDINLHNIFIYFEMPVLVKITFPTIKGMKPNIFYGPAIDIKCLAINDTGIPDDIRGIDLGLVLGAGIEFWKISVDIRYNRGLLNFDKSADDINLKNSTISFIAGYSF